MKDILLCDNGDYLRVADLCEKYNMGVEIQAFYDPEYLVANPSALETQKAGYKHINIYSMHGPFADLCFGSYDRLIKEATRNRFEYVYEIATKLGCKDVVLHHGYVPGTSHYPNWLKRGKVFWDEFFKDKNDDITFHIENMLEYDPNLISDMINTVNDNRLNICLDVGHAHCNSKTSTLDWIVKLNSQIGYVHLHNNFGSKDEHLGFEKGTMMFEEICRALEEYSPNAIWSIETNINDMESSILWLQANNYFDF